MPQLCSGTCKKVRAKDFSGNNRYSLGMKWCSLCAIFMKIDGYSCPCCKTKLRLGPKTKKYEVPRL